MAIHLKNKKEFEDILRHYKVSTHGISVLHNVNFVGMLGITSSGRNTIMNRLVQQNDFYYIVSDTTRPPRLNDGVIEGDGEVYWFRQEFDMLDDLKKGLYLEAELIHDQQVSGVSIRELERASLEHKIAITDIDHEGVHNILQVKPDAIIILTVAPSFKEWMNRLNKRGAMEPTEVKRRLSTAITMLEFVQNRYQGTIQCVINDSIKVATEQVAAISHGDKSFDAQRDEALEVIHELMQGAKDYIANF